MAIPEQTSCTTYYDQNFPNQMMVNTASKGMWSHMTAQDGHNAVIVSVPLSLVNLRVTGRFPPEDFD
eukprot:scaffold44573_cov15-Prasinocladus_malaysianus.AAC.1